MKKITRDDLRQFLQQDPTLAIVEVLDPESYETFHLPRAMNVPLGQEFDRSIQQALPDKSQRIVVYCKDEESTASPTAARKMERLGYENVYDYPGGKLDWKGSGLPVETASPSTNA